MKIAFGCDHAGFKLKETVKARLAEQGHECKDFGTFDESSVDYPDYAFYVGKAVAAGEYERGILICGTGIGIGIAANKIPGIRAALCHDLFSAEATRQHNDSNILTMGARVITEELALQIVDIWLNTDFVGAHHTARLEKIRNIEDAMAVEHAEELARLVQQEEDA